MIRLRLEKKLLIPVFPILNLLGLEPINHYMQATDFASCNTLRRIVLIEESYARDINMIANRTK